MTAEDAASIRRLLHLSAIDEASSLLGLGSFTPERYISAVSESVSFFEKFYN